MEVKLAILQKERLVCAINIDFINLGISESNTLAEVGNKALWNNFDVLYPKILVIKLEFVF